VIDMEKLIDVFCHAIRITDPLSIKIAVGIVGGGLPLIFLIAALIKLKRLRGVGARNHGARLSQTRQRELSVR
jgi:hypothetical protein